METKTVSELKKIRIDLDMLINLYARLINRLVPEEEPEPGDIKAIRSRAKMTSESKLMKALDA